MKENAKVYSGLHSDVIRQFEMKGKKDYRFRASKDNEDTLRLMVQYALKKAFADFNFRTLEKNNRFKSLYKSWEDKRKAERRKLPRGLKGAEPTVTGYLMQRLGEKFENRFVKYFQEDPLPETEFDDWHHTTCQMFLDNLDGKNDFQDKTLYPPIYKNLKYGKAQKIVNMMFKHLYCFNSEENWEDKWAPYFQHCHITLDNFTLEWFERQVPPHKRIESWSNLDYDGAVVETENYLFYLEKIRKFFQDKENLTAFQAEFYIWPEIQLRLAAEAFLFELNPKTYKGMGKKPQEAKMKLLKLPVEELIQEVKDTIKEYQPR